MAQATINKERQWAESLVANMQMMAAGSATASEGEQ